MCISINSHIKETMLLLLTRKLIHGLFQSLLPICASKSTFSTSLGSWQLSSPPLLYHVIPFKLLSLTKHFLQRFLKSGFKCASSVQEDFIEGMSFRRETVRHDLVGRTQFVLWNCIISYSGPKTRITLRTF